MADVDTTVQVAADYRQTLSGGWLAEIDALLHPDDDEGLTTKAAGATLEECHARVLGLLHVLADQVGQPCATIHSINGSPSEFAARIPARTATP